MRILGLSSIDHAGRIALTTATVLYVVGLLIENIHLARCGIADLTLVRPRYIFVGAAFLIYTAIPFALITVPFVIIAYLKSLPLLIRILLAVLALLQASFFITVPFSYFVVTVTPIHIFFNVWGFNQGFWEIYRPYYFAYPSVAAYVFMLVVRSFKLQVSRFAIASLSALSIIAPLWLLIPYTWNVFPNIDFSVGGAQPPIVTLASKDRNAQEYAGSLEKLTDDDNTRFLLWHTDSAFIYVSPLKKDRDLFLVQAVPIDEIARVQFHNARVVFDVKTRIARHPRFEALLLPVDDVN